MGTAVSPSAAGSGLAPVRSTGTDPVPVSVLLVDDRPANLVALEATLSPLGARLVSATSGPEALRHLLHEEFAVMLIDVQMPGMDGFETASLVKQHPRTAHIPIIFITAIEREASHVFTGYERGGVDYLVKPFDPTILRSKVAVFCELYRKEKRIQQQAQLLRESDRRDLERRSEERFHSLLDAMPLCVWALTREGVPSFANRAYLQYAGYEQVAAGLLSAVHPDDQDRVRTAWDDAQARCQPLEIELRLQRASDGAYHWHVARFVPERDGDGRISGWIGTATDIENQKRAEERYEQLAVKEGHARQEAEAANRAKDEFLATLSHELRTPLNAMVGWTRMLRSRTLSAEKEEKALEIIERNARAQAELIEDILDVSRIITGKLRIEMQTVDIAGIVEGALDAVRPGAEAKAITLEKKLGRIPSPFAADPVRLQQVIWNLLSNAIKFTPAGGRVELRADAEDGELRIEVQDSGRGISPDFKPYVFDRFRQLDSSSRRMHGGLGLGLAIVRHLVELHGGTVSCDSDGEGHGATFTVRLPLRAGTPQALAVTPIAPRTGTPHPIAERHADLAGIKVLLVDDEPDARELLTEVLQQSGAVVLSAHDADEAVRLVQREHPDVLLSDIGLPGQDGYKLIGRIRALPPDDGGDLPAAAITAYARSDDARRAFAAGYQRHAPKPIHPTTLTSLVAELAHGRLAGGSRNLGSSSEPAPSAGA